MKHILNTLKELFTIKIEFLPIAVLMLGLIFEISGYTDSVAKYLALSIDNIYKYQSDTELLTVYLFIVIVVFAPIVEEIFKYSAKSFGFMQEFIFILCCYEFSFYLMNGGNAGLNIYRLIFVRSLAVMLHYTTGLIISEGFEKDRKKTYLCFAILGHAFFNCVGFFTTHNLNLLN